MKKLLFFITTSLFFFGITYSENSDIYKKIDLFGEVLEKINEEYVDEVCLLYTSPSPRDGLLSRMPSSA